MTKVIKYTIFSIIIRWIQHVKTYGYTDILIPDFKVDEIP